MERTSKRVPKEQSSVTDDDDELNIETEIDEETQSHTEPDFDLVMEEQWVRVNDKAPIWMRWVAFSVVPV